VVTTAVIDLMVPSQTSGVRYNVPVGSFIVNAFPGLRTALVREPEMVEVHLTGLDGASRVPAVVAVPDLVGAVVVKALAAQRSGRERDRTDVEHLLHCAVATGIRLPAPTSGNLDYERAAAYLHGLSVVGRSTTTRRRLEQQADDGDQVTTLVLCLHPERHAGVGQRRIRGGVDDLLGEATQGRLAVGALQHGLPGTAARTGAARTAPAARRPRHVWRRDGARGSCAAARAAHRPTDATRLRR
jgi:hypothetical protein